MVELLKIREGVARRGGYHFNTILLWLFFKPDAQVFFVGGEAKFSTICDKHEILQCGWALNA